MASVEGAKMATADTKVIKTYDTFFIAATLLEFDAGPSNITLMGQISREYVLSDSLHNEGAMRCL